MSCKNIETYAGGGDDGDRFRWQAEMLAVRGESNRSMQQRAVHLTRYEQMPMMSVPMTSKASKQSIEQSIFQSVRKSDSAFKPRITCAASMAAENELAAWQVGSPSLESLHQRPR
jgi:hypothetical protein